MIITAYMKQIVVIIGAYQFFQLRTKFCSTSCCPGELHMQRNGLRIINVDFDATGYLLIVHSVTLANQNSIQEEIKSRLQSRNACYHSVQNLLSSRLLSKNLKITVHRTIFCLLFCMVVKLGRSHSWRNVA